MTFYENKDTPKVSVLMANFNNGKFIRAAIESVMSQSYPNVELIIVDDCSVENTKSIIEDILAKNENIIYLRNIKNLGYGATLKKCAKFATGEYYAVLDSDDFILPDAITFLMNEILQNPALSAVYSNMYMCDEFLNVIGINDKIGPVPPGMTYQMVKAEQQGHILHFRIFRRSMYDQTEGFNKKFKKAIDKDLIYKLEEVGDLKYVDIPLLYYRQHSGSISLFKNKWVARLWETRAKELAYLRRRGTLIPSLDKGEIMKQYTEVYRQLCFEALEDKLYGNFLKLLFQMFLKTRSATATLRFGYYSVKKIKYPDLFP